MNNRLINISSLSTICLLISLKLFQNIGIYVDEFNISSNVVFGNSLWLYLD